MVTVASENQLFNLVDKTRVRSRSGTKRHGVDAESQGSQQQPGQRQPTAWQQVTSCMGRVLRRVSGHGKGIREQSAESDAEYQLSQYI
ncbi:MAG: hypothetical protein M1440_06935 [Gammaproteobacteria bacterium]|nr:hypothetical protein [Gammaproteobacteria bacterium]